MVDGALVDIILMIVSISVFLILIEGKFNIKNKEEDLHDRLDVIEDSLKVVAAVLQQIPDMVPRFELQNNPLSQILEFITSMRGDHDDAEGSISANLLRDAAGRFSEDGKEEEKTQPTEV